MSDFNDFQAEDLAFDEAWDWQGFDDSEDDSEDDGWSERDDWDDADSLVSVGWGVDEDYGLPPF